MQFRVIEVTDPHTNNARPPVAKTQTGPITIHCATKFSTQCNNSHWTEMEKDRTGQLIPGVTGDEITRAEFFLLMCTNESPMSDPAAATQSLCTLLYTTITQMPRGSCQLFLQRTGGDLEDAPASHG